MVQKRGFAPALHVIYRDTLQSTQDYLAACAQYRPEWTLVVARRQTGGRGRRGRMWASPEGTLTFSLLLRPEIDPEMAGVVSAAASLSLCEALSYYAPGARIKWPNDIISDGGKLAGVLTDASMRGDALEWMIVGIGVNVSSDTGIISDMCSDSHAASLRGCGASALRIMETFLVRMSSYYSQIHAGVSDSILERFASRCSTLGRTVSYGDIAGTAAGISSRGSLLVETDTGVRSLIACDIMEA